MKLGIMVQMWMIIMASTTLIYQRLRLKKKLIDGGFFIKGGRFMIAKLVVKIPKLANPT